MITKYSKVYFDSSINNSILKDFFSSEFYKVIKISLLLLIIGSN